MSPQRKARRRRRKIGEAAFPGVAAREAEAPAPRILRPARREAPASRPATSASAAPHRREAGLMARLSLTPRSYRRTPGARSPGSGGLAGSLLPAATASGSGPAAGEHREPGEGGHGLG